MEPTSEQELKQLLDEGRITEEEYRELLEAIRQKETVPESVDVPPKPAAPKARSGFGRAALVLFVLSIVLPFISIALNIIFKLPYILHPDGLFLAMPFFCLGLLCGVVAFIFGIIGWNTISGKITVIAIPCFGLLIMPALLYLSLFYLRDVEQQRQKLYRTQDILEQEIRPQRENNIKKKTLPLPPFCRRSFDRFDCSIKVLHVRAPTFIIRTDRLAG